MGCRPRALHYKRDTFYYKNIGEYEVPECNPRRQFFEAKSEDFFLAASNIEFCVFPRLDSPRGVSDKTQTMSGLSGAPSGTASQTI